MLCECGQHEATIHEVIITSGKKKVERHLCEQCARDRGMSVDPYIPISQLISSANYIMGQVITSETDDSESDTEPTEIDQSSDQIEDMSVEISLDSTDLRPMSKPRTPAQSCVGCGQVYSSFKKSGLLGCPACYQVFEDRIGPMIERAHEGGCNHVGKVPRRALCESKDANDPNRLEALLGDIRQREECLDALRKRLVKSIRDEEYEHAAMLRDELTRLTTMAGSQIEPSPLPSSPITTISQTPKPDTAT